MSVWAIVWDRQKTIDIREWSIWGGCRIERLYSVYIYVYIYICIHIFPPVHLFDIGEEMGTCIDYERKRWF